MRKPHLLSRRDWVVRAAAASLLPAAAGLAPLTHAPRQETAPRTPDEALRALTEGNARFIRGAATGAQRGVARLMELGEKQEPFACVLACADSRVPVELLYDQGFGDLFVTRVAGNIATASIIASLEFGTEVLGAHLIVVLGHTACGAVKAAMAGAAVPGQIGSLYPYIRPAVQATKGGDVGAAIAANVRNQVDILENASPVLAQRIKAGRLKVAGQVLDFASGRLDSV